MKHRPFEQLDAVLTADQRRILDRLEKGRAIGATFCGGGSLMYEDAPIIANLVRRGLAKCVGLGWMITAGGRRSLGLE